MRIDYIENSRVEPTNTNVLWLNNGVMKYWSSGWKAIAGGGDSTTVVTNWKPAYDYTDKKVKALQSEVDSLKTTVEIYKTQVESSNKEMESVRAELSQTRDELTQTREYLDEIKSWYVLLNNGETLDDVTSKNE
jgi:uncharacterized protein YlxW (UPF0749 family)